MFRVRQLLSSLNYVELVKSGTIPDLTLQLPSSALAVKKYPPWVHLNKQTGYPIFGLFMEYVLRKFISSFIPASDNDSVNLLNTLNPEIVTAFQSYHNIGKTWNQCLPEAYFLASLSLGCPRKLELEEKYRTSLYPFIGSICSDLKTQWPKDLLPSVKYNVELASQGDLLIEGHPDIWSDHVILDIKTTANFAKMSEESFLPRSIALAVPPQLTGRAKR